MASKTSSLAEAFLFIEILSRIPRTHFITSSQLLENLAAAGIEVRMRKLQRYMATICEYDQFGIECDKRSRPYGYRRTVKGTTIAATQLSANESLLLRLAQEHMRFLMPPSLSRSLSPLFEAASSNFSESGAGTPQEAWLKKIAVVSGTIPMIAPNIKPRIFDDVSEALFREVKLEIEYRNTAEKTVTGIVSPLGLVQQDVRLYLVCRFDGFDNIRHLALHRLTDTRLTELASERPKDFTLDEYIRSRLFNYTNGKSEKILLQFEFTNPKTALNLSETPFNRSQRIQKLSGSLWRLTVEIEDSPLLDGWLAVWSDISGIRNLTKTPLDAA